MNLLEATRRLEEQSTLPAVIARKLEPHGKPPFMTSFPVMNLGIRTAPAWHYLQAYLEVHAGYDLRTFPKPGTALVFGENLAISVIGAADPDIVYLGELHGLSASESEAVAKEVKNLQDVGSKIAKGTTNLKKVALTVLKADLNEAKDLIVFMGTPYTKYDLFEWGDDSGPGWRTFVFGPSNVKKTVEAIQAKAADKVLKKFWVRDASGGDYASS